MRKPTLPTDRPLRSLEKETLCIIAEKQAEAKKIGKSLSDLFCLHTADLDHLPDNKAGPLTFVDIDLTRCRDLLQLRHWLRRSAKSEPAIFAVDHDSRIQLVRAFSLGASDIVFRPLTGQVLRSKLLASSRAPGFDEQTVAIATTLSALESAFLTAGAGTRLDTTLLTTAGNTLINQIEAYGLVDWVQAVRAHHNQTYQHCLLVAGAAAAFALELGFRHADRQRVATAALLHDMGKARIPVAILDKPSKLDREELEAVRQHPQFGFEALLGADDLHPEMLEIVMNHHEFLDGSGYPNGLSGKEISDLTRIVTIADIFGALIEYRAYKPPMAADEAYQVLVEMGPKLDRDLVRAFEPLSHVNFQ